MTIDDRIAEVCSLKDGWLDGSGAAIDVDPTWVQFVVNSLMTMGMTQPGIFPTPEGYVQLEWDDGKEIIVT